MSVRTSAPTRTSTSAWRLVAERELSTKLRDKTFVWSFVITLLLLLAGVGASAFLGDRPRTWEVAVSGGEGAAVVEQAGKIAADLPRETTIDVEEVADRAAAEALVDDDEVDAALLPAGSAGEGWEVVGVRELDADLSGLLAEAVAAVGLQQNADRLGTSPEDLLAGTAVTERLLSEGDVDPDQAALLGFVLALLFFLGAFTYGLTIAQSVVEEKQSRVVEILAAAVPVRSLLTGKVVGATLLALGQITVLLVASAAGLALTGQRELLDAVGRAGPAFVVFFVLGFVALACLWAVTGSVATRQEDLQSTTLPVQAVLFVVYFGAFVGGERWQEIASFVPVASSVAMPARLLEGDVPLWQPVVSALLVAVTAVLLVRLGARLYEGSLLRTDRCTTMREALTPER